LEKWYKSNAKDNKSYLLEYIQKIFDEAKKVDDNIELEYLQELIQTYYSRSLLTDVEREERELIE
jgi:hypothetical protein